MFFQKQSTLYETKVRINYLFVIIMIMMIKNLNYDNSFTQKTLNNQVAKTSYILRNF